MKLSICYILTLFITLINRGVYNYIMDLAREIKQYYFENLESLSEDKRFHFASRIAAWEGSPEAIKILRELKSYVLPTDVETVLSGILNKPAGNLYGKELRKSYFEKYPKLFGVHNALFRIRHLKEIYGIDVREDFLRIVDQNELEILYRKLINDEGALRILSRFAVDYIFLYEILYGINKRMDPSLILSQRKDYDLNDTVQLHLFIYLYTHSIIADSNFYVKKVPDDRLPLYRKMLEELESIIAGRGDIKLDNKFEYLVACRICEWETPLAAEITRRASLSLSHHGKFVVDELNSNLNDGLNSFAGSEHRNVLFIMSSSPFNPRSTLIS